MTRFKRFGVVFTGLITILFFLEFMPLAEDGTPEAEAINAVVADLDEPLGQKMLTKSSQEFFTHEGKYQILLPVGFGWPGEFLKADK